MAGGAPHAPTDFRARVQVFVERHVQPHIARWEDERVVPLALFGALAAEGILSEFAPERPNGFIHKRLLAEALGAERALGVAAVLLSHLNAPLWLISMQADPELREKLLARMLDGTIVGSLGITEPAGGTDLVHAISTRIEAQGDELVVNGDKTFVVNLPGAHFVIVLGRSADRKDGLGLSFVLVPTDAEGVRCTRLPTSGMHSAAIGQVSLLDVRVPRSYRIGRPHRAFLILHQALAEERLVGSAALLACARSALDLTVQGALRREMYGGFQADLQTVRHKLADCEADLVLGEALLERSSHEWLDGAPTAQTAIAMTKLYCGERAESVIARCAQLAGGAGYLQGSIIGRAYRDIRAASIFAGTSEAMRKIVADRLRL